MGRQPLALAAAPDLRHPAFLVAALVAAAGIVASVSFALFETDMWQHLAVGRAILTLHAFPTRQLWTWPTYGTSDVNAAWTFRLLMWWIWSHWGLVGLFAWRWVSTLATFGLLWAAARRMGARGLSPLVVLVLCSLVYRQRSQIRPDTLVAVLLAAQIWIHEGRRAASRAVDRASDPIPWLIVIAWAWANAHISFLIGLLVQGVYLVADRSYRDAPARGVLERWRLDGWKGPACVLAASIAISFVNPWGWAALWQPFDFYLNRHEPMIASISELLPLNWKFNRTNGLALLLAGWPLLSLWRARRSRLDLVEFILVPLFAVLTFRSARFIGPLALFAAPFLSRDLDAWVRSRDWSWIPGSVTARAALVALACVLVGLPEWTQSALPLRIGLLPNYYPMRACDFIAAHDVRGRGFNQFETGGYMVFRFWPDRSRLPFMEADLLRGIHESGAEEDRYLSWLAENDVGAWQRLDQKYRFDYVLLYTRQGATAHLIDYVSADTATWALVFSDDTAGLFLRRDGPLAAQADSFAYRYLPAGRGSMLDVMILSQSDSTMHRALEAELERAIASSPGNGRAKMLLAPLAMIGGQKERATMLAEDALRLDPNRAGANALLGEIALAENRSRDALRHLEREEATQGEQASLDVEMARCWVRLGEPDRARLRYRRALRLDPENAAARDSLAALAPATVQ